MAPCFSITSPSREKSRFFHISHSRLLLLYHGRFPSSITPGSGKELFSKLEKRKEDFLLSSPAQKKGFFSPSPPPVFQSPGGSNGTPENTGDAGIRRSAFPLFPEQNIRGKINVWTDTKKGRRCPQGERDNAFWEEKYSDSEEQSAWQGEYQRSDHENVLLRP